MIDSLFGSNLPSCPHLLTRGELSQLPPPFLSHRGSRVKLTKKFASLLIYLVSSLFFFPLDVLVLLCLLRILKGGGLSSRDGMLWKLTEVKKEVRWRDVDQLTLCVSKDLDSCVRCKTNAFRNCDSVEVHLFLHLLYDSNIFLCYLK